jgi:chromosome segregation protein
VEACLGDLLQHVVVENAQHAASGFEVVRAAGAGRCGFLIAGWAPDGAHEGSGNGANLAAAAGQTIGDGAVPMSSVVRVAGRFAGAIRSAIGEAWIVDSYPRAGAASALTPLPVATLDGDVFRGPCLVSGGSRLDGRGILETKREIKELRDRIAADQEALFRVAQETAEFEATIAQASNAIAALNAEHHKQEKAVVAYETRLQHAADEALRHDQKSEQLARERWQAEDEREGLSRRQEEARTAIARLDGEQRAADERLTAAQRRLFEARETAEDSSHRAGAARADHAALVERAAALASDVCRLEEAAADLDARAAALSAESREGRRRAAELHAAIASGQVQLDADVARLDRLRLDVGIADDAVAALRTGTDEHDAEVRTARVAFEAARTVSSDLDLARATAESDLSHLSTSCVETLQATLDEVLDAVDHLPAADARPTAEVDVRPPASAGEAGLDDGDETLTDDLRTGAEDLGADRPVACPEEAIARLKDRIDRLGPVNMMAIEQFDELEARHAFLRTERADLVTSIAQTTEAIRRIDETTRRRFTEAFTAINRNFQESFATLFGGGRAGLTLLDENDPLESGIDIIAQPPGKRLQSVQLLSGGEKALTAIALMFGMFKYKPSPFCLLDEIDAPLDDANIGRFVEMLRGMQHCTQFIVITHNRKTMEIADRLYGVTMEEPGVSKLISVQLN